MFDIIIIGAGPSGAHFAKLAAKDKSLKIALVDARYFDLPSPSHKTCGGLLSTHAQKELKRGNMIIPPSIQVMPQLTQVSTFDLSNHLHRFYSRTYVNIDRPAFERWLIDLIPKHVDCEFGARVIKMSNEGDHFKVTLSRNHETFDLETKILVGADGADSSVRRTFFSDRPFPKRYVSIQEHYTCSSQTKSFFGFFDEQVTDYYSWALQKESELWIGSALEIDGHVHEKFDLLKKRLKEIPDFKLDDFKVSEGAIINRPLALNQLSFHKGSVALIGEASGSISPSSAEGFSFAFKSARLLSKQILLKGPNSLALRNYDRSCWRIRLTILFKLMKSPGMYHPWLRKIVMITGISSINHRESVLMKKKGS